MPRRKIHHSHRAPREDLARRRARRRGRGRRGIQSFFKHRGTPRPMGLGMRSSGR